MSGITDEMSREVISKITAASPKAVKKTAEGVKKTANTAVKGVCLVIKGGKFTTESVMKAITGDIKYSHRNMKISRLMQSDTVKKIDDVLTAEVMRYFDRHCKKYGVKYSAMKDSKDPENPVYMVFYEGKRTAVVEEVFRKASAEYLKDQKKKKKKQAEKKPERESVRAKLAFFRYRAGTDGQDVKNHSREHQKERADRQAR